MKWLNFTRRNDWWEFKIPLYLGIGYLSIVHSNKIDNIPQAIGYLVFMLVSLMLGAIYVSVINDFTDIEEDLIVNKPNQLATMKPWARYALLFGLITLLALFTFYYYSHDINGLIFYLGAVVAFTLYSVPPFRFKNRRILGVFCDAAGAHLFPTLLIGVSMDNFLGHSQALLFYVGLGLWAFCYGLRGILWHQYTDLENDEKVNVKTFAKQVSIYKMKKWQWGIIVFEIISFVILIYGCFDYFIYILLGIYLITILLFTHTIKMHYIIIVRLNEFRWNFFMKSFYQSVFPVGLIAIMSIHSPWCAILLLLHFISFPNNFILMFTHSKMLLQYIKLRGFRLHQDF